MNKELKEQARKEFDKLGGDYLLEDYTEPLPDGHLTRGFDFPESARELDPDKVKQFIDSLIDKTVQMTEERIKESVLMNMTSNKNGEYISVSTLFSIITNNSDINK